MIQLRYHRATRCFFLSINVSNVGIEESLDSIGIDFLRFSMRQLAKTFDFAFRVFQIMHRRFASIWISVLLLSLIVQLGSSTIRIRATDEDDESAGDERSEDLPDSKTTTTATIESIVDGIVNNEDESESETTANSTTTISHEEPAEEATTITTTITTTTTESPTPPPVEVQKKQFLTEVND